MRDKIIELVEVAGFQQTEETKDLKIKRSSLSSVNRLKRES
jgi:hypothetical protein